MQFTVGVVRPLIWYSVYGFGGWEGIACLDAGEKMRGMGGNV
jgi:hypothetical protein